MRLDELKSAPAETKPAASASATAGQDYKETRLQIRLASGGKPIPSHFRVILVRVWIIVANFN